MFGPTRKENRKEKVFLGWSGTSGHRGRLPDPWTPGFCSHLSPWTCLPNNFFQDQLFFISCFHSKDPLRREAIIDLLFPRLPSVSSPCAFPPGLYFIHRICSDLLCLLVDCNFSLVWTPQGWDGLQGSDLRAWDSRCSINRTRVLTGFFCLQIYLFHPANAFRLWSFLGGKQILEEGHYFVLLLGKKWSGLSESFFENDRKVLIASKIHNF